MASQKNKYEKQFDLNSGMHLGSTWEPNEIRHAAEGYLSAAEMVFETERMKNGFLAFPNWFVVHHISYIASELFLKSFAAKVVSLLGEQLGCDNQGVTISERGHGGLFEKLPQEEKEELENHLTPEHITMLSEMSRPEFTRSRYPYQLNDRNGKPEIFPTGDNGKEIAQRWLSLARALSGFRVLVEVVEVND